MWYVGLTYTENPLLLIWNANAWPASSLLPGNPTCLSRSLSGAAAQSWGDQVPWVTCKMLALMESCLKYTRACCFNRWKNWSIAKHFLLRQGHHCPSGSVFRASCCTCCLCTGISASRLLFPDWNWLLSVRGHILLLVVCWPLAFKFIVILVPTVSYNKNR